MKFASIFSAITSNLWIIGIVLLVVLFFWFVGVRFIPNNKVGIVEKVLSRKKGNEGSIIALNGEAGFQAKLLRGGIHILPRIVYKVHKENIITISQGEIGYVFARDGKALTPSQTLGKVVECNNFEDVEAFLRLGGQKGPQRSILREGTYVINLAQFIVITADEVYYMSLGLPEEKKQIAEMKNLINQRNGFHPQLISDSNDEIGIVTTHDGPSIKEDELIADHVDGHNKFQDPQSFIDKGGCRGRQRDVLTDGTYFINVLFATVEKAEKYEIPIGQVGVVNYFTGKKGKDVSGENYKHGDLVREGAKGVWADVLTPGKYPWNKYAGQIYSVPTTNFILKWSRDDNSDFGYDSNLEEITLITKDAFQPSLPLSVVIHINYHDAPKVIQRFGDIETLVNETLDPLVGAYFKNIGQTKTLLELIQERSQIQKTAADEMKVKFEEYDLNLVEVLIGTPKSSREDSRIDLIYKQLQDRQLAKEESLTLEAKKETEEKKRDFAEAEKIAEMQADLTDSNLQIQITENRGKAEVKKAEQDAMVMEKNAMAQSTKTKIDAEAEAIRKKIMADAEAKQVTIAADAEAHKIEVSAQAKAKGISMEGEANADAKARIGIADALGISEKVNALGSKNLAQIEIARAIARAIENAQENLVPNSVVNMGSNSEGNSGSIIELLLLKLLSPEALESNSYNKDASDIMKKTSEKYKKEVIDKATVEKEQEDDNGVCYGQGKNPQKQEGQDNEADSEDSHEEFFLGGFCYDDIDD